MQRQRVNKTRGKKGKNTPGSRLELKIQVLFLIPLVGSFHLLKMSNLARSYDNEPQLTVESIENGSIKFVLSRCSLAFANSFRRQVLAHLFEFL